MLPRKQITKKLYSILQDRRFRQKARFNLGQVVRTADIKRNFSKGDSTNWSYILYTKNEVNHDNIPSYRINYLPRDIMRIC